MNLVENSQMDSLENSLNFSERRLKQEEDADDLDSANTSRRREKGAKYLVDEQFKS